ncbi:MAG: zinc ribbon domain-containing protein [Methanoregula sp.]|jgi:RNA polymerase subunit RPABC4/transcription elongation factor Spt4
MTKTCGICGHAGLDDQAQFCNRCGAVIPEEKKPAFPVCPGCGTIVTDELAQFCNRCGTIIHPGPVVCRNCGSPAIDNQSRFCTRCGTTFEQKPVIRSPVCPSCGTPDPNGQSAFCNRCGAAMNPQGIQPGYRQDHASVIVGQRKPVAPMPVAVVPDTDWEPWNEAPPALGISRSEPPIPEKPVFHDKQVAVREKRYAHLPLIADELKTKGEAAPPQSSSDIPDVPPRKGGGAPKKGVLGFMRK